MRDFSVPRCQLFGLASSASSTVAYSMPSIFPMYPKSVYIGKYLLLCIQRMYLYTAFSVQRLVLYLVKASIKTCRFVPLIYYGHGFDNRRKLSRYTALHASPKPPHMGILEWDFRKPFIKFSSYGCALWTYQIDGYVLHDVGCINCLILVYLLLMVILQHRCSYQSIGAPIFIKLQQYA